MASTAKAAPTRVLLVDDHHMFTELMTVVLGIHDDLEVVGRAGDADEALAAARRDRPDVVVVDYQLPGADGVATAARLRREVPDARVVMLTGREDDPNLVMEAVAAGCSGFVTKDRASDELVAAIRTVRNGNVAVPASVLGRFGEPPARTRTDRFGLTAREREILRLLAEGCSTRQVADRCCISLNTARNHVQRVIRKLGAHSRLEAVAVATRTGLLDDRR
jgi:DNA-binding NarL/FixJ family response regulator